MQFDHPMQHSIARLEELETAIRKPHIALREAVFLADRLVAHVHPMAPAFVDVLEKQATHKNVVELADLLRRCWNNAAKYFRYEQLSPAERERYYAFDGALLLKRGTSAKLLVVWTTMFNNFYLSNAALATILGQLDCSILLLKDSTHFNYLKGVRNFAPDLFSIGPAIVQLAQKEGFEAIYHAAYSSSGYAALYTALSTPSRGYLGFSPWVDMRAGSPLPAPFYFSEEVREKVDPSLMFDLKPLLANADPSVPRTIIYGTNNWRDSANAKYVEELDTVDVIALAKTSHNTVMPYLADDRLLEPFVRTIAG
ncbi:MAG: hypothetical protein KDE55_05360 [Novosphingobium sp.]|nr:hypothetical protein [Novosphingobium sp.]